MSYPPEQDLRIAEAPDRLMALYSRQLHESAERARLFEGDRVEAVKRGELWKPWVPEYTGSPSGPFCGVVGTGPFMPRQIW